MKTGRILAAAVALALSDAPFAQAADTASAQDNVLTYEAVFFADARPNTAYDMVQRLPGFTFDDGGSARGFAGNAGNVVIDGQRPTSKTDDLQSILARIPASDVDRIELIRGGATGIDMHGQTVIANVIRKDVASTSIVAEASNNIFTNGETVPEVKVDFTRHSGGWLYEGSISRFANFDDSVGTGFHDITDASGKTIRNNAHDTGRGAGSSFNGAVTFPLFGGQFKTNLTLRDSPFRSSLVYKSPGFLQIIIDDSDSRRAELGLHWNGHVGGPTLEALALQRLGHATEVNASDDPTLAQKFFSSNNTGESIARATLRYEMFDGLTIEGGGEGAFNFLDGHTAFISNGVPVALPSADVRVEERRGEVFTDATWKISNAFTFEAGTRYEFSTISESGDTTKKRSFSFLKPRAVLSWTPDKNTQVRLRAERIVGQLDFNNFVATSDLSATGVSAGNPDLRPEQRMQYALSYERHFWDKGAAVVTLLHEQISDVVDFVPIFAPSGAFDAPGNIGGGKNDEIDLELTLPLDRLGITDGLLKTSAVWRHSEVRDPVTGEMRRISVQRPQAIEVDLTQDIDRWKSTWGITFFNGWDQNYFRLTSVQHKHVIPPFLAAFWEYKPADGWSLRFETDNIVPFVFDQEQVFFSGPRNVSPVNEIEHISIQSQPRFFIRIRKTFV